MAVKWFSGVEWGAVTTGVEFSLAFGGATVSSTTKHTGNYAIRVNNTTIYTAKGINHTFNATDLTKVFAQYWIYIHTSVNAETTCFALYDTGVGAMTVSMHLTTDDKLNLWYNDTATQVGGNSSALSKDTWYCVEVKLDKSGAGGTHIVEARINQAAAFASVTNATVTNGAGVFGVGMELNGDGATTMDVFFDDFDVDDAVYPGGSRVVAALPTGAGDNAATTGDYTCINEVPPSATATTTTTMVELDSNGVIADYNVTDTSTLGIDYYDTIRGVSVLARVREEAAGTSSYQLRIKSASGGTVTSTTAADAGNATARTNPAATVAFGRPLLSLTDPTTGVAWTPKGTNSIENMQIGVTNVDSDSTPDLWILTMAAMVAYKDGSVPTVALTGTVTASITETDIVSGGKTIILTLTNDTWVASGATFNAQRQNIINGITSAQSETTGWNLVPKVLQGVTGVVRTSDTVVTITLDAQATYNITAQETITVTVPATAMVLNTALVATPTFTVDTASSGNSYTKDLSDTFSWSEVISRVSTKVISDTQTITENATKKATIVKSDTETTTDTIKKTPTKVVSDTYSWVENIIKKATKVVSDTFTNTEALIRDTIVKRSDTVTTTDTIAKTTTKPLSDSFSWSEVISSAILKVKILTDEVFTFTDSIVKDTTKQISQAISWTEDLSFVKYIVRVLQDSISFTEGIIKTTTKRISDGISWAESLLYGSVFYRTLTDTISWTENVRKSISRSYNDALTMADTISKQAQKQIVDTFMTIDTIRVYLNGLWQRWINKVKTALSFSNKEKNTESWDNSSKASVTFTNTAKSSTTLTNKAKGSNTWDNKPNE